MKIGIVSAILCSLIVSADVLAFTWSSPVLITGYFVYDQGGMHLKTSNNTNPDGCANSTYLAIDSNSPKFKELYATVVAAHAAGSTVSLNYDGCLGTHPKIISVAVPSIW